MLLASILEEYRENLETLHFDFGAYRLGNRSLLVLGSGIKNLLSLRNFTLILPRKGVQSKRRTVMELLDTLIFLKNLETIQIDNPFESRPRDFESLLRKMGRHWNLRTFEVNSQNIL